MNKKLHWGLLSTAKINDAIIPGIKQSPYSELYGVASRSIQRAREYASARGIPHAYGSYQDMVDDPNIDVVYNSLPNHLHAEWSIRAAEAGKHVLCEKPMALSHQEMLSIKAAALKNKVVMMEAIMYRSHPRTQKVLDLVAQGVLGEVLFLRGSYTNLLQREEDYRWVPEYGGGSLWDIGIYPVSYAMMIAKGAPIHVFGSQVMSKSGVDIAFAGQLIFNYHLHAQFDCGFNAPYQSFFEIRGSKATLFIHFPFARINQISKIILRQDNSETLIPYEDVDGFSIQVEKFNLAILNSLPPAISLDESIQINLTLLALLESAKKNGVESLPPRI